MAIDIRKASREDLRSVIGLLREFAAFEKLENYLEITEENLAAVLFGDEAFVECLVASDGDDLVGYSIFYPNFATFRGQKGMYLEDIYVSPKHRSSGLGKAMLTEVANIGRSRGCKRIDFVVLDWNEFAIKFYEKHGAVRDEQERRFKFVGDAFRALCS